MYLFLQQGPANTTTYMIAGYAVIFIVMLVYTCQSGHPPQKLEPGPGRFAGAGKRRRNGLSGDKLV